MNLGKTSVDRREGGARLRGVTRVSRAGEPLVTVITAVRNGGLVLHETIRSVAGQTYPNVEYIVIDGGSSDNTVAALMEAGDAIDYWVSEPDAGIADAFNKGIALAHGDWINFQGAGDGFWSDDVIGRVVTLAAGDTEAIVAGDVMRIAEDGAPLFRFRVPAKFRKASLLFRMSLPHQGLFAPRAMFRRYGLFDTANTFAMDYEHLLRAYRTFPRVVLCHDIVARWRAGGIGSGRTREVLSEYDRIKRANRVAPAPVLMLIDAWSRFKHALKSLLGRTA